MNLTILTFILLLISVTCIHLSDANDTLFYKPTKEPSSKFWKFIKLLYFPKNDGKSKFHSLLTELVHLDSTSNDIEQLKVAWENFKSKFKKDYKTIEEEAERFVQFLENFLYIVKHNLKYDKGEVKFSLSINHLSDYKPEEYLVLLGVKSQRKKRPSRLQYMSPMTPVKLPASVDWRGTAVTPIKNQGFCGSCWAFSSTGSIEGQHFRRTGHLVSLSEQQLVDCNTDNSGCGGGLMDIAFDYVQKNHGIDSETAYPYISGKTDRRSPSCNFSVGDVAATVEGHVDILTGSEEKLAEAVVLVGPISVAIDASQHSFMHYHSGVYEDLDCNSTQLDHAVLLVGYGRDHDSLIPYWLVKNSWGTSWGESGFIRMRKDAGNMCGIATMASYPIV